jgi:hypothetical protein
MCPVTTEAIDEHRYSTLAATSRLADLRPSGMRAMSIVTKSLYSSSVRPSAAARPPSPWSIAPGDTAFTRMP